MGTSFTLARLSIAAGACAVALGAAADEQTFYKSVLPDGRIVYGDTPSATAKHTEKITVRVHTPSPQAAADARRALEMNRQGLLRDAAARNARLSQLEIDIAATYNELKTAEAEREKGREIQEGDRQGRWLLPQYTQRQRMLEGAVRQARQRLDKLVAERAALRY